MSHKLKQKVKALKVNLKNILALAIYYILLSIGLLCVSWIIYARFIRNRSIKDLPLALSEYGFWVLLYLCLLYLFSTIILIINKAPNDTVKIIIEIIYKPMITLDHFIRYNKHLKDHMYVMLEKVITILSMLSQKTLLLIAVFFQIIPRIFLIIFLLRDIWFFHHIEIFYKIIFIGFIPFIYRYLKYILKDLKQQYILILEEKYETVWMIEIDTEEGVKYDTDISIKEYIEFKTYEKIYASKKITFGNYAYYTHVKYNEIITPKEETYAKYRVKHNISLEKVLTDEDDIQMAVLFNTLMPKIMLLSVFLEKYSIIENHRIIRWAKVIIFSLYFISWGYVLLISCYAYPVTFENTAYNLVKTLLEIEEPFSNTRL